uniref:Uncharacterized protein n=1 Tax=Vitis vinifera TaxID=29760 RepID=A5C800_VITVI|nr:hypothetical protein VITISV_016560 [Vitis vinifera]
MPIVMEWHRQLQREMRELVASLFRMKEKYSGCSVEVFSIEQMEGPPNDTWHTPLSESTLSVPPRGHVAYTSIQIPQGHTTLSNIIFGQCSILSGPIVRIIDCNAQALLSHPRQPATAHVPPPAKRKDRSDGKSPPRSLTAACRAVEYLHGIGWTGNIRNPIENRANSLKIEKEVTNGVANGDVAGSGLKKQ